MINLDTEFLRKIKEFDIPVVESHDSIDNPLKFIEYTRRLKGVEGFVIAWDSGYRVKLKSEEYCRFHSTKDIMTLEKNIVSLLVNEKIDDTKPFMMDEDRVRVEEFEGKFWNGITKTVHRYEDMWNELCAHKLDRKRFALERVPQLKNKDPNAAGIMFGRFDNKDTRTMVLNLIKNNCNTQTKIDNIRYLWGDVRWSYAFEDDN
jgi:RNA ligase